MKFFIESAAHPLLQPRKRDDPSTFKHFPVVSLRHTSLHYSNEPSRGNKCNRKAINIVEPGCTHQLMAFFLFSKKGLDRNRRLQES